MTVDRLYLVLRYCGLSHMEAAARSILAGLGSDWISEPLWRQRP